jgi:hypothetical protein
LREKEIEGRRNIGKEKQREGETEGKRNRGKEKQRER